MSDTGEASGADGPGEQAAGTPLRPMVAEPRSLTERSYSRAFENIVQGSGDIVGLLAYSLFKEAIREEARQGSPQDGSSRNPPPATVNAFRMAAEQRLTEVVKGGIEEATPDIERNSFTSAVSVLEGELKAHVTQRTGFGMALLTNIIAWLTTLAIAAIIIFLLNRPSAERVVADTAQQLEGGTAKGGKQ